MSFTTIRKVGTRAATIVGAVVITAVVVSGTLAVAQAATESVPNNSVTSAKIVNDSVQGVDIKDGTVTPADLQLRIRPRYAHVSSNSGGASIVNARGVSSVSRFSAGEYLVTFVDNIIGCGWTATLSDADAGSSAPGEISVERHTAGDAKTLRVNTYNSAGVAADTASSDGFTVRVDCP